MKDITRRKPLRPRTAVRQRRLTVGEAQFTQADIREQLVNDGEFGPINKVSIPEANVTSLRGIMLDVDPKLFKPCLRNTPAKLYNDVIAPMLARHPVLAKAQVRMSGSGLHVILRLHPPVTFENEGERQRWAAIVKVIQRLLPTDPNAPGITAVTRPVGSTNSKSGKKVGMLAEGQTVTAEEVLALFCEVANAPVATVMKILLGEDRVSPCPICQNEGSALRALERVAKCYLCGNHKLAAIYDLFLSPMAVAKEGA